MQATILGCGEAFDELLPNTSVLLRWNGAAMLLDCGFSAAPQVWKAFPDASEIDAVWISHAHADHYFGLPPLTGRMWEEGRTKPLVIFSRQEVIDSVRQALEIGYRGLPSRYKYLIEYRAVTPGSAAEFRGATLRFADSRHAVPNLAIRIDAGGQAFCYSGDGMFTDAGRDLFSRADLLVHEAYLFEENPVHADIPRLLEMAGRQEVRRLAMVHVQRSLRREPKRLLEVVNRSGDRVCLPEPMARFGVG